MKKFAKISLVAAVAISGFSTSLLGKSLEDAIKNVEVSGTATYKYNDYGKKSDNKNATDDNKHSSTTNNYKVGLNISSKINDNFKANSRVVAGSWSGETGGKDAKADSKINVDLTELNFDYTGLQNTTLTLGKQTLENSFIDGESSTGTDRTGTGLKAVSTMGAVTLTAAYFNQTNLDQTSDITHKVPVKGKDGKPEIDPTTKKTKTEDKSIFNGSENIAYVSALASFSGVNLDAAYMKIEDIFDAYTVGLDASYDLSDLTLSPYARYSSLKFDKNFAKVNGKDEKNSLWKAGLKLQAGIFGAHLGYGQTGSKGGTVSVNTDSPAGYDEHWAVTLTGKKDASVIYASVNAQVLPSTNVAVKYSTLDDKTKADKNEREIYGQVTYDFSKNFEGYAKVGQHKVDDKISAKEIDQTLGRLQLQYSF